MGKIKILGESLANIPWEDRKDGENGVLWRSSKNPIIKRDAIKHSNSIFNSAVVPYKDGFVGVFRVDDDARRQGLHTGFSKDGVNWDIREDKIEFERTDGEIEPFIVGYDPRVVKIEDKYYVTWCNEWHGPTIGIAYTYDFEKFYELENSFLPYNRNGVLFPRRINGNYAMLSRPSDTAHTPFGDIFYSQSPDMTYWGKHRFVMKPENGSWQSTKVGAGPIPIELEDGWLMIYHGVLTSCNGFVYSMGGAILDKEKPWIVKHRCRRYLLSPQRDYECVGDVPNVAFPCAALTDADTGRITIYYGGADTVVCMAHGYVDEIVEYIKENDMIEHR